MINTEQDQAKLLSSKKIRAAVRRNIKDLLYSGGLEVLANFESPFVVNSRLSGSVTVMQGRAACTNSSEVKKDVGLDQDQQ